MGVLNSITPMTQEASASAAGAGPAPAGPAPAPGLASSSAGSPQQVLNGSSSAAKASAAPEAEQVDYNTWPIKELRRFLTERGKDPSGIVEKADLVAQVIDLQPLKYLVYLGRLMIALIILTEIALCQRQTLWQRRDRGLSLHSSDG